MNLPSLSPAKTITILRFILSQYLLLRKREIKVYLFGERVARGKETIALTIDSRVSTSTNCIHYPMSIIIVYNMEITMSTPEITTKESALLILVANNHRKENMKCMTNLGILCISPSPKWLYAIVTCINLSLVYESLCPINITCIIHQETSSQLFNTPYTIQFTILTNLATKSTKIHSKNVILQQIHHQFH